MLLVGPASAEPQNPGAAPARRVEVVDSLGLTITLPQGLTGIAPLDPREKNEQIRVGWRGMLGKSRLSILLYALPVAKFSFAEPEDVNDLILRNQLERDPSFAFEHTDLVSGAFGYAALGAIGWGALHSKDGAKVESSYFVLGGLLEKDGYSLEVVATPPIDAAGERAVLDFLHTGVVYAGKQLDPKWTDDEHRERWLRDVPEDLQKKLEKPVRTEHYIFLSNTASAKDMAKSMEANYAVIQKTYPFEERPSRRLMPVFLFRTAAEYHSFYAKVLQSTVETAARSKGVAYQDFYATYFEAKGDPVHIHEGTHQVFRNRLRLGGGGSWFQEGVAEYICTRATERVEATNAVKKERHTKLAEFIAVKSLLRDAKTDKKSGDTAMSQYLQAALLIEFVHESKWSKDKFQDWVHAIGLCPDNNVVAIERATQATLGVDLAELEKRWVEYCKKR
ncbi:MAG: hypothetical protein HZA53_15425 [Planctomycetes bacterium]|nr:hypothetical protein [Planctomycetota bacterium]